MTGDEKEQALILAAQLIKNDFDTCVSSSMSDVDKVYQCRSLLLRLSAEFRGLQSGSSDKISNQLHWEIHDYLASFKNDKGESLAASME